MKRFTTLLALFSIVFPLLAAVTIPLKKESNTYMVKCAINGHVVEMMFDTGCSDLLISDSLAQILRKEGRLLPADDNLGQANSIIANGEKMDGINFNIKDLQIGDIHLHNVCGSIGTYHASLLLGNAVLDKLTPYTKYANKIEFHINQTDIEMLNLPQLNKQLNEADAQNKWEKCLSISTKIYQHPDCPADNRAYYLHNIAYYNKKIQRHQASISACDQYLQLYLHENDSATAQIYRIKGDIYFELKDYEKAANAYAQSIKFVPDAITCYNVATSIYNKNYGVNEQVKEYIRKAYALRCKELNISPSTPCTRTNDEFLQSCCNILND